MTDIALVTGAFGYSGSRIAARLLAQGWRVRTVTSSTPHGEYVERVEAFPLDFADPAGLRRAFEGVRVFYNTYWVRFSAAGFDQAEAVTNSELLFRLAADEGVGRIVHTSITNPSADCAWAYFRHKARLERSLEELDLPRSILRPAVLFGGGDVLVNNIAWLLRRFPVFGVFGDGRYRLRPIHVDDFAALAAAEGGEEGVRVVDAVGPERFEYRELVRVLGEAIGKRRPQVRLSPAIGALAARVLGRVVRDVLLTREEIGALMEGRLDTDGEATGGTRLSAWAREHAAELGVRYASEVARRRRER